MGDRGAAPAPATPAKLEELRAKMVRPDPLPAPHVRVSLPRERRRPVTVLGVFPSSADLDAGDQRSLAFWQSTAATLDFDVLGVPWTRRLARHRLRDHFFHIAPAMLVEPTDSLFPGLPHVLALGFQHPLWVAARAVLGDRAAAAVSDAAIDAAIQRGARILPLERNPHITELRLAASSLPASWTPPLLRYLSAEEKHAALWALWTSDRPGLQHVVQTLGQRFADDVLRRTRSAKEALLASAGSPPSSSSSSSSLPRAVPPAPGPAGSIPSPPSPPSPPLPSPSPPPSSPSSSPPSPPSPPSSSMMSLSEEERLAAALRDAFQCLGEVVGGRSLSFRDLVMLRRGADALMVVEGRLIEHAVARTPTSEDLSNPLPWEEDRRFQSRLERTEVAAFLLHETPSEQLVALVEGPAVPLLQRVWGRVSEERARDLVREPAHHALRTTAVPVAGAAATVGAWLGLRRVAPRVAKAALATALVGGLAAGHTYLRLVEETHAFRVQLKMLDAFHARMDERVEALEQERNQSQLDPRGAMKRSIPPLDARRRT